MVRLVNTAKVVDRIIFTFNRYERDAYNIMKFYAAEATAYFIQVQTSVPAEQKGEFWTNHTFKAAEAFFAKAFQVPSNFMGVTFAYTPSPDYTASLEEDYNGRFAALPKMLAKYYPLIERDLKILYGDNR